MVILSFSVAETPPALPGRYWQFSGRGIKGDRTVRSFNSLRYSPSRFLLVLGFAPRPESPDLRLFTFHFDVVFVDSR